MADVEIVGIPFDGFGRPGHQSGAAAALRAAGFADAWSAHRVVADQDLDLPGPTPDRGEATSLINEAALLEMVAAVGQRVRDAVDRGVFPVVVGADCSTLLGTIPALRTDQVGLLFVDGHEDTMPLDVSEDGEAANSEIGLLLGFAGRRLVGPLAERLPALTCDQIVLLGQRDDEWRRQFNVGSLRDLGVWMRDCAEVAAAPAESGRAAAQQLRASDGRWWLHVDLDVLDPEVFPAQGLPDVDDEPGGLTWEELEQTLIAAVSAGGCVGSSFAIYDPDQDPDRSGARRIVRLVTAVADALDQVGQTSRTTNVVSSAR